jgi:glycine/D-amino acid oxidase-like deaminating enzyme/nitrite reductase/ring-hydroxylating ferredoxin subunit
MKRDGNNKSLWQNNIRAYKLGPYDAGDQIFDVIIVGGGITGVTTAWELQQAGQKCLIAEAKNLCFGTTGGTTAHLNNFFDTSYAEVISDFGKQEAKILALAATEALSLYKKNIQAQAIDCEYQEGEGVLYALDEKQAEELDEIYHGSIVAGVDVQYTGEIPVPIPFKKAISFPGQGQIHPVKYVYGLARAFEKAGGVILDSCFVNEVESGDILTIRTSRGILKAKKVIYASHIPPGINLLHLRCAPYRSYVMAVTLEDGGYPENPAYDMMDPYHYYRTQEVDGKKYLIAGGEDHKTGHEENTELPFERLEHYLRKFFKISNIDFRWSSQYFEPADGLAYIGHLPGTSENIFVATGFGGNGMTYSHIAAMVLTAAITSGVKLYDNLFSPARIKPFAGFAAFVKENADVVSSFIGDRLKISSLSSLAEIRKNSGQIVKYDQHSIAVHKNGSGKLSVVNPVCTHLKCMVKWNQTEKSWDCPCHGARYSVEGEVLTGPGNRHLEKIDLPQEKEKSEQSNMTSP